MQLTDKQRCRCKKIYYDSCSQGIPHIWILFGAMQTIFPQVTCIGQSRWSFILRRRIMTYQPHTNLIVLSLLLDSSWLHTPLDLTEVNSYIGRPLPKPILPFLQVYHSWTTFTIVIACTTWCDRKQNVATQLQIASMRKIGPRGRKNWKFLNKRTIFLIGQ